MIDEFPALGKLEIALIGVQPAFAFGVIAFFGELVPIIGPVIVSIPALFVAASLGLVSLGWPFSVFCSFSRSRPTF